MRKPSQYVQTGAATDIDSAMTPMIDVVFLLLVFFVWTASFQIIEQVMPSQLSQAAGADPVEQVDVPEPADFDNLVIRIRMQNEAPTWFVSDQPLGDLADVKKQLTTIAQISTDAPVILYPDQNVPLEHIVDAWDAAKVSGFAKVQFAVSGEAR
ncbi:ExbD/TolR family protein [Mariniblastus fucicola]|uniref:Biopolymer transport protein ExbD/TolR n=1 Tax=Mariniblastus fucicola TaxID=980251 RepID=A0A5B9PG75_9BACT|nr:biopolymer transporter ExbD [Mariniblastus fucicola]QEG24599.1 Biopolymer transport protein ExbD/TolR [Mariniblastus fucicola]